MTQPKRNNSILRYFYAVKCPPNNEIYTRRTYLRGKEVAKYFYGHLFALGGLAFGQFDHSPAGMLNLTHLHNGNNQVV